MAWPEGSTCEASFGSLPVEGWLFASDTRCRVYAVNYTADKIIPIAEDNWAVTPDGKYVIAEARGGSLCVRPLDLPKAVTEDEPATPSHSTE